MNAQLGVTRYAVLSNGAAVLDVKTGEWLYRRPLDPDARRTILTLLLDWGLPFEVYCEGENYIQRDRAEQVIGSALSPEFAQVLRTCSHFPEDLNAALEGKDVEKIHIFRVPPERRQALLDGGDHLVWRKYGAYRPRRQQGNGGAGPVCPIGSGAGAGHGLWGRGQRPGAAALVWLVLCHGQRQR